MSNRLPCRAEAGRVFPHLGSASGLAATPAWSWSANQASGLTGTAAAAAGDVDGDGLADVVIGTPQWTIGPTTMAGRITIFHGGPAGLPATPTYERRASTPPENARFGFAVETAGRVNGDAYDDVAGRRGAAGRRVERDLARARRAWAGRSGRALFRADGGGRGGRPGAPGPVTFEAESRPVATVRTRRTLGCCLGILHLSTPAGLANG